MRGGGLGRPLVVGLLAAGARVVVSGRTAPAIDGTHAVAADLRLPGEPERLVEEAVAHLGRLDGLVHAAGVVAFGKGVEADDDLLDELFLADAIGPIRLLRAAVPHLRDGNDAFAAVVTRRRRREAAGRDGPLLRGQGRPVGLRHGPGPEERSRVRVLDVRPPHTETGWRRGPSPGPRRSCRRAWTRGRGRPHPARDHRG